MAELTKEEMKRAKEIFPNFTDRELKNYFSYPHNKLLLNNTGEK